MADWINESVAIYSSRSVVENLFRLLMFILLILGSVAAAIRLIKSMAKEVKALEGKRIRLDNVLGYILIAICVLLALVVAIVGVVVEILTLKQIL